LPNNVRVLLSRHKPSLMLSRLYDSQLLPYLQSLAVQVGGPHLNGAGIHIVEGSLLTAVSLIARPLIGELMAVASLSVSSFIYPSE
jgi:hypothetical protein